MDDEDDVDSEVNDPGSDADDEDNDDDDLSSSGEGHDDDDMQSDDLEWDEDDDQDDELSYDDPEYQEMLAEAIRQSLRDARLAEHDQGPSAGQDGLSRAATARPVRRYRWLDYDVTAEPQPRNWNPHLD